MEVCPVWLAILFFIASVHIVNTSVNTSLDSKVKTSQSSDTDVAYTSDEVVDNCTTQKLDSACCSHTNSNPTPNEAWWQIDLGDQVVIEYIQIYYRDEGPFQTARFAGYQIYLSNTTGWRNSDSCYNDATSTQCMVDLTPRITTCTGNNRYLTIYVDRQTKSNNWYSTQAILELCEVQVYGCPVRKYGISNCDSNCDTTCVNSLCHPNSGQCTYCAPGFYKSGLVCTACPTKCLNDLCNVESGVCSACANGYHGSQCDQSCSNNCQDKNCDQYSSVCTGCVDRFFGPLCVACSPNCVDPVCDKSSGNCIRCEQEFHGSTCQQRCPIACKDNTCSQFSGQCEECAVGYHGNQCDMNCPFNCKDKFCNKTNGRCIECVSGFHGSECVDRCGYCQDGRCDKDTGNCMTSCIDGLTGHRCDIKVVSLPCKEDDFNAAAVGIGSGFGVVIVALVIVIIVQARRHRSMIHQNTTRSTTMTDISLPSIGQERRTETDGTYAVIGAQKREENITNMSARDSSYEQLGHRERDVPNLYETT